MNELINDMRWLACVLLFICAICDANDDLGAYTACRCSYDSTDNWTEKDCDGQKSNRFRITKPTIMRLARTKGGRGIIVGALSAFYTFNDLWHEGGDKPETYSIGEAFSIYSPQYIAFREKTSIYQRCSRTFKN